MVGTMVFYIYCHAMIILMYVCVCVYVLYCWFGQSKLLYPYDKTYFIMLNNHVYASKYIFVSI